MSPKTIAMVAACVGVLGATRPASAHHSFASVFDADKPVEVHGVLVEIRLQNPHSWFYVDVTAITMLLVQTGSAYAQNRTDRPPAGQTKAAAGPMPRAADGHPDLSGVWWPGADVPDTNLRVGSSGGRPEGQPRQGPKTFASFYQPWAAEKAKTLDEKDDPALRCIPGVIGPHVSLTDQGLIGQIIQTPKFVVLLTETYHSFKLVPT